MTTQAIVCVLVLSTTVFAQRAEVLRSRVEATAATLPWLDIGSVIYAREPRSGPDAEAVARGMRELQGNWSADEIRPLLKHADPKVRTLAIALLLDLDRVDVLPDIATLLSDSAPTFPEPQHMAHAFTGEQIKKPWPMTARTVADYATAVIQNSAEASYALEAQRLPMDRPGAVEGRLREFVSNRDPRLSTAAMLMSMKRATGGISPVQPERIRRIDAVLSRLQEIPMPRRFFVALRIDFERYGPVTDRYSPDFLLSLAREVPREVRLSALDGTNTIDPNLSAGFGADYILAHAVHLLRVSDAPMLLKSAATTQPSIPARQSAYLIAAAQLKPDGAESILIPAFARFPEAYQQDDRTRMATALARLGSEKGVDAAINWFFAEQPQRGAFGFGREAFLGALCERDPVRYRDVVERIVRDKRLTNLGPQSTRILITTVAGYLGRELATEAEIDDSRGIDEFQRDRELQSLPRWHRALQNTVDQWSR